MALSDGDLYVSGSILSFQQMIRVYTNFRAASVPSALQAGALWSDSTDDRLYHQGASAIIEVFTEKTTLTWENLLSNSGFGYWPQSDASKGLATITYDQGAKGAGAAPSVGDAVVGGTSGATAKVISYTIATGAFATNDATGIVTVGAVSHDFAFVDNETITFGGVETAVVNMADSAVQVGLVQNGGFAAATTGWTVTDGTLASVAGGQVGNCLQITRTGGNEQYAKQDITTVIGKIYKASLYVKSGTSGNEAFYAEAVVGTRIGSAVGTSAAGWVLYTFTFEATGTTTRINISKNTATAGTMLFDEVTCYEITPCEISGTAGFDGSFKDGAGLGLYRQHNDGGTYTKDGSFYSLKMVPGGASNWFYWDVGRVALEEYYQRFAGRTIAIGCWVKTSTASHFRLAPHDGSYHYSDFHTGGGDWEWLETSFTVSSSVTNLRLFMFTETMGNVDGTTIVYLSQPMLVFGSHIGEGNYAPIQNEMIWGAKPIPSNKYDGLTDQDDFTEDLNIEADSDAMLPKGAKAIAVLTSVLDSGSAAAADIHLQLRRDATSDFFYVNSLAGRANDLHAHNSGIQPCDVNGDVDIHIDSSGADTFDIEVFEYHGVQVN